MPERTCICCRVKREKEDFFRVSKEKDEYIFDVDKKVQSRGFYVCKENSCIEKLSKHKKYKIKINELLKMLEEIKKEKKDIIDILRPMKNSDFFVFGIDENIEEIRKKKVKLLILPKNINSKYIEKFEKLKNNFSFKIVYISEKKSLIELFSRDVNVVGILDKKVVSGILKKVEVKDEKKGT